MTFWKFLPGLLIAVSAHALTPPPLWPDTVLSAPNTSEDPAKLFLLGDFRVVLEKTTLNKIRSIAPAPIQHEGDASEALDWVCYTLEESRQRLWLSSSEMGGGIYIDGVTLAKISPADANTKDCPPLPKILQRPRFQPDIRIGAGIGDVEKKLGKARVRNGADYEYQTKRGNWDVSGSMALTVRDGKIVTIQITHTTSN